MRFRRMIGSGPLGRYTRAGLIAATCCIALAYVAENRPDTMRGAEALEPVQYSIWKKRIKRLKLADPESTEEMLARTVTPRITPGNGSA